MERAAEKLEKASARVRSRISGRPRSELAEAKARLEEILRQLREEEIERTLALLETRIKQMLEAEIRIHDETLRLAQAMEVSDDRGLEIEAGKLSFEQRRIASEADKALMLLREEGSSAAFPETLEQARDDMQQVASRLAQAKSEASRRELRTTSLPPWKKCWKPFSKPSKNSNSETNRMLLRRRTG